jgi:hypothetical protein
LKIELALSEMLIVKKNRIVPGHHRGTKVLNVKPVLDIIFEIMTVGV